MIFHIFSEKEDFCPRKENQKKDYIFQLESGSITQKNQYIFPHPSPRLYPQIKP